MLTTIPTLVKGLAHVLQEYTNFCPTHKLSRWRSWIRPPTMMKMQMALRQQALSLVIIEVRKRWVASLACQCMRVRNVHNRKLTTVLNWPILLNHIKMLPLPRLELKDIFSRVPRISSSLCSLFYSHISALPIDKNSSCPRRSAGNVTASTSKESLSIPLKDTKTCGSSRSELKDLPTVSTEVANKFLSCLPILPLQKDPSSTRLTELMRLVRPRSRGTDALVNST